MRTGDGHSRPHRQPVPRNAQRRCVDIATLDLSLKNDLSELAVAAERVDRFCAANDLPSGVAFAVNLAVDELLTNTIKYGYVDGGAHRIDMTVRLDGGVLVIELADDARPYDPTLVPYPDLEAPVEERPIGGLGVHFVRQKMDGFSYRRVGGRNIVTLTKDTRDDGAAG